jgi:hypothetical protein
MDRIKEKTSNSSNSYLFVFDDINIIPIDDENYNDVIVFDDVNDNNIFAFNNESKEDSFTFDNDFAENSFVFENERYERQYFNKYAHHNSLFVLEGKNDYLFIGMFFLLIAFFLLGGFYF